MMFNFLKTYQMKLIAYFFPIFLLISSCGSNESDETTRENSNQVLTEFTSLNFEGALKAKSDIPIAMTLNKTGQNIVGSMLYKKVGEPIKVIGTIDEAGTIQLQELIDDQVTGSYEGQIINRIFNGIWKSGNGKTSFDFALNTSSKDFSSFIKKKKDLFSQYTGLYEIKPSENQDADYHYLFEIEQTGEDNIKFLFYGSRGKPSYNMGSMEGNAVLKDKFAVYEDDDNCKFKLTFSENGLKAEALNEEEYDCGFGFGVYFEGDYIKTNSDKPAFENYMR